MSARDSVASRDSFNGLIAAFVSRANRSNVVLLEFCIRPFFSSLSRNEWGRMPTVIGLRKPLKVFDAIVGLIEVLVIDGRAMDVRRRAEECDGDDSMNEGGMSSLILAKNHDAISAQISLSQAFAFLFARARMMASHLALIRDFVKAFVSNHVFPDFFHSLSPLKTKY